MKMVLKMLILSAEDGKIILAIMGMMIVASDVIVY